KHGTYTNTDRRVQLGRPAIPSPGDARPDWQVLCDLSARLGYPMRYESPAAVFDEFTALAPSYSGLNHTNLTGGGKIWPYTPGRAGGVSPLLAPGVADRGSQQGADAPRSPDDYIGDLVLF